MYKLRQATTAMKPERLWNLAFWASLAACEAVGLFLAHT